MILRFWLKEAQTTVTKPNLAVVLSIPSTFTVRMSQ